MCCDQQTMAIMLTLCVAGVYNNSADAEIRFEQVRLETSGLPTTLGPTACIAIDSPPLGRTTIFLAGAWQESDEHYTGVLVTKTDGKSLALVATALRRVVTVASNGMVEDTIDELTSCDIDNDGVPEVFALAQGKSARHGMMRCTGAEWSDGPAPFEGANHPRLAWLDYDDDGWLDLYLAQDKRLDGKLIQEARWYRNDHGRLNDVSAAAGAEDLINSVHVLDFNADGRPDLLLCGAALLTQYPSFNRVLINRGDRFDELETPVQGVDKLIGLDAATVAAGDIDGDGSQAIVISGQWSAIGYKGVVSLLYKNRQVPDKGTYQLTYDAKRADTVPDLRGPFVIRDLD